MAYLLADTFEALSSPELLDWPDGRRPRLVATSVPYWGLRGYGTDLCSTPWGASGETLAEYLDKARRFASLVWDVLDRDGWAAINIGDTRTGSGGSGGDYLAGGGYAGRARYRQGAAIVDEQLLAARQLAGVPWRLAEIFRDQGFLIRSMVTWVKDSPKPEDMGHVRRFLGQSETVVIAEKGTAKFYPEQATQRADVWQIGKARLPKVTPRPKAPWPPALAEAIIGPLSTAGDVVLDPFAGCGITGLQAEHMGRRSVMIDGDPDALESYLALRAVSRKVVTGEY